LELKKKTHERNRMKAVVVENYDSIDGISIKEIETPGLSKGEVRVKVGAAAVGFVDGLKVQGLYPDQGPPAVRPGHRVCRHRRCRLPTMSPPSSLVCR
jgi:D-arabinose 1-dehydrogenase-like Zn-dependent alcohol dehydrogenase